MAAQSSVKNTRSCEPNRSTNTKHVRSQRPSYVTGTNKQTLLPHPVADSGDDGVEVLDFALQQHHPGTLSAVGHRMVEQHVEEVAEFGGDAAVLQGVKIRDQGSGLTCGGDQTEQSF